MEVVPPVGFAGGLAVLWSVSVNIQVVISTQHFVCCKVVECNALEWLLVCVYGSPAVANRSSVWQQLSNALTPFDYPILVIGDFNQILSPADKFGGRMFNQAQASPLLQLTQHLGLSEVQHGVWYTWTNNRAGYSCIYERLDRALASHRWLMSFPYAVLRNLPIMHSDHGPIFINTRYHPRKHIPVLRFEAFWKKKAARSIVAKSWVANPSNPASPMKAVSSQLAITLGHLLNWHKKSHRALDNRIVTLRSNLEQAQKALLSHNQPLSRSDAQV
ncbi:OLC1v1025040C1 [Oldenlandia corymbosa var. corymbosa]|uniref:OLC1v1025040C1 n=1 Tax=Oldenlandia corymbosa var. corymbosa TaxID=529605 RepID=A0AAV1C5H1_OLDCO|nr:OLC1v1025040C1 [Oldenlandia corymbosa var. corymbosa]